MANVDLLDVTNFMVDERGSRFAQAEETLIKVLSVAPRHVILVLAVVQRHNSSCRRLAAAIESHRALVDAAQDGC